MTQETEARRVPTQADRDAAADICVDGQLSEVIHAGRYDSHQYVASFARHASTARAEGIKEGLRMAADRAVEMQKRIGDMPNRELIAYNRACREVADALYASPLAPGEGEGR